MKRQQAWRIAVLVGLIALTGCVQSPQFNLSYRLHDSGAPIDAACLQSFAEHQRVLFGDASFSQPLPSLPALRLNRTLAHWRFTELDAASQVLWLTWSHALALETAQTMGLSVQSCSTEVWRVAITDPAFVQLISAAVMADEYQTWLRFVGLYPVTRLPFASGVKAELAHQQQRQLSFESRVLSPSDWMFYQPLAVGRYNPSLAYSEVLSGYGDIGHLLGRWAPTFAVQQNANDANLIGGIQRALDGELYFDAIEPAKLYRYASWGEYRGAPVLQLNYQVWFSRRPSKSHLDPLAGRLDGIHWRVHLGQDTQPIAFDVMHTCGCWYQVYPAQGYAVQPANDFWQEPFFVGPALNIESGPLLLISADEHSVVGVRTPVSINTPHPLQPVDISWASIGQFVPLGDAAIAYRRSFNGRGIIPESDRIERFYFWPMGIPKAGSMRAMGHHAIAFTGRAHFDDPKLLEALGLVVLDR